MKPLTCIDNPHYSHIPYFLKFTCNSKISPCSVFVVIRGQVWSSKVFELLDAHVPNEVKQGDALPLYFSSYCK